MVLPRALPGPQHADDGTAGTRLVVMVLNTKEGGADPRAVVRLVRKRNVDVLAIVQAQKRALAELQAAGVRRVLPYAGARSDSGANLLSRTPLRDTLVVSPRTRPQVESGLRLADGRLLRVRTVHAPSPTTTDKHEQWRTTLRRIPGPRQGDTPACCSATSTPRWTIASCAGCLSAVRRCR